MVGLFVTAFVPVRGPSLGFSPAGASALSIDDQSFTERSELE